MAAVHSRAARFAGAVILVVASSDEQSAQAATKRLGLGDVYTSAESLFADPAVELVHICTPNATHFALAADALRAGKHVICEKPLTINSSEAVHLVEAAKRMVFGHRGNTANVSTKDIVCMLFETREGVIHRRRKDQVMLNITDHKGDPVTHGRATVNGVRMHYVIAGKGEPLVLVHGVPKTWYYWHRIIPILSEFYTVIAPDVRGFGDSFRPKDGYDMETIADDIVALVGEFGFDTFRLAGEDWGAAFSYAIAAKYPEKVRKLSYGEMLLPGYGLEEWSNLSAENVNSNHFLWHVSFFHVRDIPEMLITGREKLFWETWMKNETYDPAAITPDCVDEWARTSSAPGGLRAIFEVYRETFKNIEDDIRWAETKLPMPVLAVGSTYFIGAEVKNQMERVSDNVKYVELDCGHSMALERPRQLADHLIEFFKD